jgi:PPOX class probable F420-dependent enzyme
MPARLAVIDLSASIRPSLGMAACPPDFRHLLPSAHHWGMRTSLSLADLGDLLEQPIIAVLATYRRDGTVMLSPVWFDYADGAFRVWTHGESDGKVRHLRRDPRASLVIAEQRPPLRAVEVSGTVTLGAHDFYEVLRATTERYDGPDRVGAMVAAYPEPGVIISLRPQMIRAWDFRDSYPSD